MLINFGKPLRQLLTEINTAFTSKVENRNLYLYLQLEIEIARNSLGQYALDTYVQAVGYRV